MGRHEETVQEIVRGLEGLITLNEWQRFLLTDLRNKAKTAVRLGPAPAYRADHRDAEPHRGPSPPAFGAFPAREGADEGNPE